MPDKEVSSKQSGQVRVEDIEHTPSADYLEVYANIAMVGFSPWDIQINFGELRAGGVTGKPPQIVDKVCVTVSPEHADRLIQILLTKMAQRRQRYGELTEPEIELQETPEGHRPEIRARGAGVKTPETTE